MTASMSSLRPTCPLSDSDMSSRLAPSPCLSRPAPSPQSLPLPSVPQPARATVPALARLVAWGRRVRARSLAPVSWCGGLLAAGTLLVALPAQAFDFNTVAARARTLAASPYKPAPQSLPRELAELSYDRYREIEYKPERFAWRNARLPFELSFFHEGMVFDQPVRINEVVGGSVREFRFDPGAFNYGPHKIDPAKLKGLGFAGFRLMYPVNQGKRKDELASFLGASYFRALGRDQWYGLSARGLAVDTGLNSGEEFPRFVEYWIERPGPNDKQITLYALMDSRRLSGAYRFVIKPGAETVMEVKARLFLRENVTKLGLAPLTSMYLFGENQPSTTLDFRPEVHDSDGLSIHLGTGEWIWRPLVNPKRLLVTSFSTTNPQGSASCSATAVSTTTRRSAPGMNAARAAGSSPRATGAPAASSSCRSRRRTRPTTTSWPTGFPMRRPSRASRSITSIACSGRRIPATCRRYRGSRRPVAARA